MKIKTRKLSYEEVLKIEGKKLKKPKKPNMLFRVLLKLVSLPDLLSVKFKANKINLDKLNKKEQCFILMNHSSFIDLEIAVSVLFPRPMNIICTSDGFVSKNWLMREIGCISTVKFTTDTKLVREMLYAVKKLKTSILMYPEAGYSFDGTATTLADNIGKCVKLLNLPVVSIISKGAYHRQPLYNNLIKRKVPVSVDVEYILTKEDIACKSEAEISDIIKQKFGFDNFKWQQENNIIIDHPRRAEGLNRVLYKCPHCLNEGNLKGEGIYLTCPKCDKKYELTIDGYMKAVDGVTEINHIPNWYKWERECVKNEILNHTYKQECDVDVYLMMDTYNIYELGQGHFIHDENGFVLDAFDGKLHVEQSSLTSYSVNADFFWYQIGDTICIGDNKYRYYCFPRDKQDVVAKMRLAAEELFKIKNNK